MSLILKRNETVRWFLLLPAAATGTPTITIAQQAVAPVLSLAAMLPGATDKIWYYDYTTGAAAPVGAYEILYSAVINGVISPGEDGYYQSINNIDDLAADIADIDVGTGTGIYSVILNIKDQFANPINQADVQVYNSADDDTPRLAEGGTDALGNTPTLNIDGDVKVRVRAANFTYITSSHTISANGTVNLTGTTHVLTGTSDPALTTVYIVARDIKGALITSGLTLSVTSHANMTKDTAGNFYDNNPQLMTYDAIDEVWSVDLVRGLDYNITSDRMFNTDSGGNFLAHSFKAGSTNLTDLDDVIFKQTKETL